MIGNIRDKRHASIVRAGGDDQVRASVLFTHHAMKRYSERVGFCIGPIEAAGRLRADAESEGAIVSEAPEWMIEGRNEKARSVAYLVIGENHVLPLVNAPEKEADLKALTLISRGHGSHVIHRKRCEKRRKRQAGISRSPAMKKPLKSLR